MNVPKNFTLSILIITLGGTSIIPHVSQFFNFNSSITSPDLTQNKQQETPSPTPAKKLIYTLIQFYINQKPIPSIIPSLSLKEGYIIQNGLVEGLTTYLGNPVGYKVGLTNKKTQNSFQVSHPIKGVLLDKMLLKNGATVKANFGAVPRIEGDLMVRVGSDKINQAKTTQEVIEALDVIIPFLELPDLMYQKDVKITAAKLVAVNGGARLGVIGEPIALADKLKWQKQFNQIKVTLKDNTGQELGTGTSDSLLGDPVRVVLWLRDELQSQGKSLKKGDLISLGSMTPLLSIEPGQTITAQYEGLQPEKMVSLSVTFTD